MCVCGRQLMTISRWVCSLTGSGADHGHDRQTELIAVLCARRDAPPPLPGQHNCLPGVERSGWGPLARTQGSATPPQPEADELAKCSV